MQQLPEDFRDLLSLLNDGTAAGIPLEAHVAELRRRREAAACLYEGSTYFREEIEIFRQYAREKDCYLTHTPEVINLSPDDEGNEHQVWFDEATASFFKATWPDFFGRLVMQRPHESDFTIPPDKSPFQTPTEETLS